MDLEKKKKLQCWLYWYDIDKAEDLLENHHFYLILHEDYNTPIQADYHDHNDFPCFTFFTERGVEVVRLSDNKITHFAEILSKDEYLEFINLCNKSISDDKFLKAAIEQKNRVNKSIEKQEPAKKTKAKK